MSHNFFVKFRNIFNFVLRIFVFLFLAELATSQVIVPFGYWAISSTPSLTISDGSTYDYGTLAVNNNFDKTFTLTNSAPLGAAGLISAVAFATTKYTFKGGSYPGTGGTCAASLSPASSCTFVVTANSAVAGPFPDTITLNYNSSRNSSSYTTSRAITATFTATPTKLAVITNSFIKVMIALR